MSDQYAPEPAGDTQPAYHEAMADIAARSQKLVADFLARQAQNGTMTSVDPLNIGEAFLETMSRMMADPGRLVEAQFSLWQDYLTLCQTTGRRLMGQDVDPVARPAPGDRRFRHQDWDRNEVFNFIKQSYLLTAGWVQQTVGKVEGLDDKTARKVDFYTRQFTDALSPSNFVLTNPEVLRATLDSGGDNLLRGLQNLLEDLETGDGRLNVKMADEAHFEVGGDLAVTPGKVVYRNALMELVQYSPTTETVYRAPLLIIPPWINKFYILDLRPKNSLIKWAVDQGHTVFVISWVNPDSELSRKSFDDYLREGPLEAIAAIEKATGEQRINLVGYCIGGTLLACLLSWMAAKGDDRALSATFFTTLVDFGDAGDLSVFIDEEQLSHLEDKMSERGYLEGHVMATTFNLLRANDLIWSFVVNNYLLGKEPFPFDLLYWNNDSTRMPAVMHSFYLRTMYLKNLLVKPVGIELDGVPLDLRSINIPTYNVATREDHIAPWKSVYAAMSLYKGTNRFVLAASGHIAGVINPPAAEKYSHWLNTRRPKDPEAWFEGAEEKPGSWWPDWQAWLARRAGPKKTPPRIPGDGELPALCDAPGTYVSMKS